MCEKGYYYERDRWSEYWWRIGGNVAEKGGGGQCLKYGVSRKDILGVEVVVGNGDVIEVGKQGIGDEGGYDLLG
ncbi:FAD-binding protein, partial [Priestia megaterium]|uniref:FAD-binding protein n=1 Tax=Priestia megaterium TaxID=1404 RepID=UPI0021BF2E4B